MDKKILNYRKESCCFFWLALFYPIPNIDLNQKTAQDISSVFTNGLIAMALCNMCIFISFKLYWNYLLFCCSTKLYIILYPLYNKCVHMCTPVLEISGSAALNQSRNVLFFLLPVVEVFRVSIHVCDMVRNYTVFNGNLLLSRIFSSCVCGWLPCSCQTDRG